MVAKDMDMPKVSEGLVAMVAKEEVELQELLAHLVLLVPMEQVLEVMLLLSMIIILSF